MQLYCIYPQNILYLLLASAPNSLFRKQIMPIIWVIAIKTKISSGDTQLLSLHVTRHHFTTCALFCIDVFPRPHLSASSSPFTSAEAKRTVWTLSLLPLAAPSDSIFQVKEERPIKAGTAFLSFKGGLWDGRGEWAKWGKVRSGSTAWPENGSCRWRLHP